MKTTCTLLSFLLLVGACAGPSAEITAPELRSHVKWLAHDGQAGRRTGSLGAYRSADYLKDRLISAGLQPGGEDGSWYQEFPVQMPPEAGEIHLSVNDMELKGVGTVAASPDAELQAELVSASYGVVFPSHDLDDYAAVDVSGKIVLVRRYTSFGLDDDPQIASLGNLRKKIRNAEAAGAVGIILGTHPDDVALGGEAELGFKEVQGAMPIPVATLDPEAFAQLERKCLNASLPPQVALGVEVIRETKIARNLVAMLPGTNDEWIVVGAHYDHLGYGGEGSLAPGIHAVHNGADDNASGTAMTLELAEAYSLRAQVDGPAARGMLFCFWSGEEMGLLGSAYWVENPTVPLDTVVCNLNLDMVGRLEAGKVTVGSAQTAAAFAPALAGTQEALDASGAMMELNVMSTEMPGGGGSDHMSFHKKGVPAVFFFSGLHSDYHKPSDDWEKVTYGKMAELAIGLVDFLDRMVVAPRSDFAYVKPEAPKDPGTGRRSLGDGVWFGSLPDYGAMPERGMQITGTSAGSPAEKAGLHAGDIILKVGAFDIGDIYDFMDSLAEFEIGQTVTVTVLRDGKSVDLLLTFFPRSGGE